MSRVSVNLTSEGRDFHAEMLLIGRVMLHFDSRWQLIRCIWRQRR